MPAKTSACGKVAHRTSNTRSAPRTSTRKSWTSAVRGLSITGGTLWDGKRARRHRRGLHHGRRGLAEDAELGDDPSQVRPVAPVREHHEAVVAGDAVAGDHLRRALRELGDGAELARRRTAADD